MNLRKTLAALFLPTRRLVSEPDQAPLTQGGAFGGQQWVVGRGQCQYRREDLHKLPPRKRAQAGRLALVRHSPSPAALAHVAWTGGIAHYWFWTPAEPPQPAVAQRWIPETLLLPPMAEDGVRLLQLSHGFEAQLWRAGVLAASQWWEQLPGTEAWSRFLRASGSDAAAGASVPAPLQLPWSAQPWGETNWSQRLAALLEEKTAWLLLFTALAAGLGWQLAALARWQLASNRLAANVEQLRGQVGPLLSAREQAEQAQGELDRLGALRSPNDDYVLMANIGKCLPEGSTLLSWQRDGGKLQLTLRSSETDPRALVAAFANEPRLADVAVTPLPGGVMQLVFELPDGSSAATTEGGQ